MGIVRLITAPVRSVLRSRLFQLLAVVVVIMVLENYSGGNPILNQTSDAFDKLTDATVQLLAEHLRIRSFTKSILTAGLMIVYVYLILLLIFFLVRRACRMVVDLIAWSNLFYLRNTIARERGIEAYRAWEPLERIRPAHIPQDRWEEMFAWPPDNKPPYPPWRWRILRALAGYILVIIAVIALLQAFTPVPVLAWLGRVTGLWRG